MPQVLKLEAWILVRALVLTSLVTSDVILGLCFPSCKMGMIPSLGRVQYNHVGGVPDTFSFILLASALAQCEVR